MSDARHGGQRREVRYVVLPNASTPYLLARVRWPDIFEAISPARPAWRSDPGLFDLPYDPSSETITEEQAAAIAAEWGATLPDRDEIFSSGPFLMRRMPADWSNLSIAERSAWALDDVRLDSEISRGVRARWFRRRRGSEAAHTTEDVVIDLRDAPDRALSVKKVAPIDVIDLTDEKSQLATADDA